MIFCAQQTRNCHISKHVCILRRKNFMQNFDLCLLLLDCNFFFAIKTFGIINVFNTVLSHEYLNIQQNLNCFLTLCVPLQPFFPWQLSIHCRMSESDSDSSYSSVGSRTRRDLNVIEKLRPERAVSHKSKVKRTNLKAKMNQSRPVTKQRTSARVDDRKKLEDCFRDLHTEFGSLHEKFNTLYDCII